MVVGVPLAWVVLVLDQVALGVVGVHGAGGPVLAEDPEVPAHAATAAQTVLFPAWLVPSEADFGWTRPLAGLVLCVRF